MATKSEIRQKVLRKLGVLGRGQTASNSDATLVEEFITQTHANLFNRGKIYWSVNDTPDEAVNAWVMVIANECGDEFGLASPELERKAAIAMTEIAALNAVNYEGEPNEALYY
ncbi:hypothetical protein [Sneathiella glossodoripedis]|uniref:hypothetical protein n=1 Tax=Sneathiella glossodoripedis TaxID=418853 RepID=UPI00046FF4D6|nr:hypothetical protein [Sneathiella glossodoripedis]